MYTVHRGATMSFVGRHNRAIIETKQPLPARYNTPLLPLVLPRSCAAINGAQIAHRVPQNEAKPVAVPRTATGNASGVHPKSYHGVFQRSSGEHKTNAAHRCVKKGLTKVLQHVEPDIASLRVHNTEKEERDAHGHRRGNERPFSPNHRCTDHEDG
jgi:hypothetical protein